MYLYSLRRVTSENNIDHISFKTENNNDYTNYIVIIPQPLSCPQRKRGGARGRNANKWATATELN